MNTPLKENTIITGRRWKSKNSNRNTQEERETYLGQSNLRQRIQPPAACFTRQHPREETAGKQPPPSRPLVLDLTFPTSHHIPSEADALVRSRKQRSIRRRATHAMVTSDRVRSLMYLLHPQVPLIWSEPLSDSHEINVGRQTMEGGTIPDGLPARCRTIRPCRRAPTLPATALFLNLEAGGQVMANPLSAFY